jgi:ERCC4-type nuclease
MGTESSKRFTEIIVDSREQDIKGILNYFETNNIPFVRKKLDFGDYSTVDLKVIIERKRVGELAVNLASKDKNRFYREFKRAVGYKMIVMVEGSWDDVRQHNYISKISPTDLESRIKTWANHFMFKVEFVKKEDAGAFIAKTLL